MRGSPKRNRPGGLTAVAAAADVVVVVDSGFSSNRVEKKFFPPLSSLESGAYHSKTQQWLGIEQMKQSGSVFSPR